MRHREWSYAERDQLKQLFDNDSVESGNLISKQLTSEFIEDGLAMRNSTGNYEISLKGEWKFLELQEVKESEAKAKTSTPPQSPPPSSPPV